MCISYLSHPSSIFSLPSSLWFHYSNIRQSIYVAITWLCIPLLLLLLHSYLEHKWIRGMPFLAPHNHQSSWYKSVLLDTLHATFSWRKYKGWVFAETGISWFASCHHAVLKWFFIYPQIWKSVGTRFRLKVGWAGCYQQSVGGFFFMAFWETHGVFFCQFPDHEVPLKKDTSSMMR